MENKPNSVEELFSKLKDYIDTTIDLFKLKGVKKVSGFFSVFVVTIILSALLLLALMFVSIGFALLIGGWLGKMYYGFFIIAGLLIITGIILYFSRNKSIKTAISNWLIKVLFDN